MKKYLLKLIATLACLHGLAWHAVDHRQKSEPVVVLSFSHLLGSIDQQTLKLTPKSLRNARVTELKVSPKVLQFNLNGIPTRFEWIGLKGRLFKFNGRVFTAQESSDLKTFTRAFYRKFGIKRKHSLNSVLFTRAFAAIDATLFDDLDDDHAHDEVDIEFEDVELASGSDEEETPSESDIDFSKLLKTIGKKSELYEPGESLSDSSFGRSVEQHVSGFSNANIATIFKAGCSMQSAVLNNLAMAGGPQFNSCIDFSLGTNPHDIEKPSFMKPGPMRF